MTGRGPKSIRRAHHVYLLLLRAATTACLPAEAFERHRAAAARRDGADVSYDAGVDLAAAMYHRHWLAAREERNQMRLSWAHFFEGYDLLLCLTAASAAFVHDHQGDRSDRTIAVNGAREPTVDQFFWGGLSGLVYLPSTVAPAGLTRSGPPCGLQIIGPYLGDRTCIAFAKSMEREIGGFMPPPRYE